MNNTKKISIVFSILILPFTVSIVIPLVLLVLTHQRFFWHLEFPIILLPAIFGFSSIMFGTYILVITIKLFHNIGKGTLAPWNPPKSLVVIGPYKYIRNPMIGAVLLVLLGEVIITGSIILFSWLILFLITNIMYFIYSEEPELIKRFGNNYKNYKKTVPMFIPRLKIKKSKTF